jgi:small subunit ribosomal protein S11
MAQPTKKTSTKKDKKSFTNGVVHIQSTFNNTIVTITNLTGDTVSWASAGSSGFKGARKSTPFAAQTAAEKAAIEALNSGMKKVEILVKGQGSGRETAIRAIEGAGFDISSIQDITSVPHNGCRPPKRRRV